MPNIHKPLKVITWNIHGISSQSLGDKLADPDFLTQVSDFDMVCLVETHENENSSLNIFVSRK